MDVDSEATADLAVDQENDEAVEQFNGALQDSLALPAAGAISESVPASRSCDPDFVADEEGGYAAAESEDYNKQSLAPSRSTAPSRRSRASSPEAMLWAQEPSLSDPRLTARQRARLEKEAGLAEDVQWHEMELPPELQYTWKGKGHKAPNQMTEEEWLKRQEALERRRMRSLRDKREAEETVKAKIRKAVTAKFRGKLIAQAGGKEEGSGSEGEGTAADKVNKQDVPIKPGWVKVHHTADGNTTVCWHPTAHPLSYPMAVTASFHGLDPVDLLLQPPAHDAQSWQVPENSSKTFKPGCKLQLQQGPQQAQQEQLLCVDEHGWTVGCLLQQQVLIALQEAGYDAVTAQQQEQTNTAPVPEYAAVSNATPAAAAVGDWCGWQAEVRSIHRSVNSCSLAGVTVRLKPTALALGSTLMCS